MFQRKFRLIQAICGNFFEHYDMALFSLLTPFLASLFFHNDGSCSHLSSMAFFLLVTHVSRFFGALFFSFLGDSYGTEQIFIWSLLGVSITSLIFSLISPEYFLAPLLLGGVRCCQNFFAAAETPAGALFLLEDAPENEHDCLSALYDASSVFGGVFASIVLAYFSQYEGWIESYWSYFFLSGGIGGLLGVCIRRKNSSIRRKNSKKIRMIKRNYFYEVCNNYKSIFQIACGSGFSYSVYFFVFTFMSMTLPHMAQVSLGEVTVMNSYLLIADVFFLCLFAYGGFLKNRLVLLKSSVVSLVVFVPVCASYLAESTYFYIFWIRLFLVFLGTAFASTYYAWAYQIASQTKVPCFSLVMGTILGSQCIGYPGLWLSTFLFHKTYSPVMASLPILLSACLIFIILSLQRGQHSIDTKFPVQDI